MSKLEGNIFFLVNSNHLSKFTSIIIDLRIKYSEYLLPKIFAELTDDCTSIKVVFRTLYVFFISNCLFIVEVQ